VARFDVYELTGRVPLVVDVQAEIFADLKSRVVVPLLPHDAKTKVDLPRLKPVITIGGGTYVAVTTDIAAVPADRLKTLIGNVEEQRQALVDAMDFLLQGF